MSYIFEALKKLEQTRDRTSRLLLITGEAAPERKRRPSWSFSVLALLLSLNAGVLFWWAHSRQPTPVITQAPAAATRPADANEAPQPAKRPPAPIADPSQAEQAPHTKPEAPPKLRPVERGATVVDLTELPAAIKESLPPLKMSAHYYTAEPKERFTRINDLTLREGQSLPPGVKLEAITPEGVLLSYEGYRFLLGMRDNR